MSDLHEISTVRSFVAQTFAALDTGPGGEIRESILIRDGYYCGRRFEAESGTAVWFAEEKQLKFYRSDGSLVAVAQIPAAPQRPLRAAA